MQIAGKNIMLSGKLPYDSQVEYIESTGVEYIDTGIPVGPGLSLEMRLCSLNATNNPNPFGAIDYDVVGGTPRFFGIVQQNAFRMYYGNTEVPILASTSSSLANRWVNVSCGRSWVECDGFRKEGSQQENSEGTATLLLFARAKLLDGSIEVKGGDAFKISMVKIYKNGQLVRDFIPVRKSVVGYMYDRVSEKLFGNCGKGSFIVKPGLEIL